MMSGGQQIGQIALDMQQQANQLRVDDALNKAKEAALRLTYDKDAGFTNLKGINALERPDGKPLADEYSDALKRNIDDIASGLGNDAQRQLFALHSSGMLTSMRGSAMQHEAQEFKTYSLSVSDGIQSTALREIGLNWQNPDAVNSAVERIRAETYRQAQLLGKSAEWQESQARKMTSNAHKIAMMSALEQNSPAYADAYLRKYSDQMEADDILSVRGHVTKAMDAQVGSTVAGEVMSSLQPRIKTNEADRLANLVGAAGGINNPGNMRVPGGKEFQNFKTIDDGFAAMEKQLRIYHDRDGLTTLNQMLSKWAPKGDGKNDPSAYARFVAAKAGIGTDDPVDVTNPALMKRVTRAMAEMEHGPDYAKKASGMSIQDALQRFGGDVEKSVAAVKLGADVLDTAIKKAEKNNALAKNDPVIGIKSYLDFLPADARESITRTSKEFESGGGQFSRPTLEDIDMRLRADPRLANNPARYRLAREEAERLFNEQTKAIKQREEEAVTTAMRGIIENGGRFSDLPVAIRAAVPPKEVDNLIGFAQKIAKGDDSTSLWLYAKLAGNPEALARMNDNEFFALRRELSEADFKHFAGERAKRAGNVAGANGPGDLNAQAIKQSLDERLRMLQIDPSPKDDGGSDAARVGAIRRFVDQYFMAAQREAGKKFTDTEVSQHLDALFAKNTTFRGWFSTSSGPMLGMKVGDIDGATKDGIKAAYKRQGIDSPTDAQILNAYWNMKVARK